MRDHDPSRGDNVKPTMPKESLRLLTLLLALCVLTSGCLLRESNRSDDDDAADDDDTPSSELYGPDNSWWHAYADDVPGGLSGTGWNTGDVAYNFTLQDQFGDSVELYQFYGKVIVIDVFAFW